MEGNLRKGGRPKQEALPETKHVADLTRVVIFVYLSDDDEIQSKSWAAPSSILEGYTMPCLGGLPSSVKHLRCLMCNREGGGREGCHPHLKITRSHCLMMVYEQ